MGSNLPNFDRAEYIEQRPYAPETPQGSPDHAVFIKSIVYGIGAGILGCILYAAFTIVTHIEIGYLAVGVGFLVGKAMMAASENLGGQKYQIASAVLTYFAVSMASVVEILWQIHKDGVKLNLMSGRVFLFLAKYGVASPFLELKDGVNGIIGLVILIVGIRAAWRITAGTRTY